MRGWGGWLVIALCLLALGAVDRSGWWFALGVGAALMALEPREGDESDLPDDRWWR